MARYSEVAEKYAEKVLSGEKVACKWVKLACLRHKNDIKNAGTESFPYVFEPGRAERVCRFLENLPHIKGEWARRREKFVMSDWQVFITMCLYGWVHKDTGFRRFRTAYIEVARKNGKSFYVSGLGIYMLAADGEEGSEVYSAATTRDQAKLVFSSSQEMCRRDPQLRDAFGIGVHAHSLAVMSSASKYEALSSDGSSLDGLNAHFPIIDEFHAHKTPAVFDVLETATGSRTQSILFMITTAGSNRSGVCYSQRLYVGKILEDTINDESYFGIIFTIDKDDDWTERATWEKANPNLGVSVYLDDMERLCRKAMENPADQNNFLTKRLNVWVNADAAWMDMRKWEQCGNPDLKIEDFIGERCYGGLDLASKIDMNAKILLFERDGIFYIFPRFYLPEETAEEGKNSHYQGWARAGKLMLTGGNVIDLDAIEEDIRDDAKRFHLEQMAFDPYQATQLAAHLMDEGLPMVELRPTVLNFSEPMKELEKLVYSKKVVHPACPILTWMVSNVVCHRDAKDNIYPRKERQENLIDGVVASIMAIRMALLEDSGRSVYEDRDVVAI